MNLRFEILRAVGKNPGAPIADIAETVSTPRDKTSWSVQDCHTKGLLLRKRDDVTGQPGYWLTDAGKARLAEGPTSKRAGAKSAAQTTATPEKNSAVAGGDSEGGEADVSVAVPQHAKNDEVSAVTAANFNGFDPAKLPPILISCVARLWPGTEGMFWEQFIERMPDRISTIQAATEAHIDLHKEVSKANADKLNELMADLTNAQALATKCETLLASTQHERDALRAELDRLRNEGAEAVDVKEAAAAYLVRAPKRKPRILTKPESAHAAAMSAARNGSGRGDVFALVYIGSARRGAEWSAAK